MKRSYAVISALLCIVLLVVSAAPAFADNGKITLKEGQHKVGDDVPAGEYIITCTEVEDFYGDYMGYMKSLAGDDEELLGLIGLLDDVVETPTVNVKIVGPFGEEKKAFELEKNESKEILLEENTAIKIANGTCTLEAKDGNTSIADRYSTGGIQMEWGASKQEIIDSMGEPVADSELSGHKAIGYENQKISRFYADLAYIFSNDQLFAKMYMLTDYEDGTYKYLKDALTSKYGAPNDDIDDLILFMELYGGEKYSKLQMETALSMGVFDYNSWNDGGNTVIIMLANKSDKQLMLYYGQQWDLIPQEELDMEGL